MSAKTRTFYVTFVAKIEVSKSLIKAASSKEWRNKFYDLRSGEQVAEHLAFNLVQGRLLSQLDGFADQPCESAMLREFRADSTEESDE